MGTFGNHLQELHLYFHNSANRTAALKSAATILGKSRCALNSFCIQEPYSLQFYHLVYLVLKSILLVEKDVRWLCQHLAIQNLQRNLPAVLTKADIKKCPVAKGLYTFCATYRYGCFFVCVLHLGSCHNHSIEEHHGGRWHPTPRVIPIPLSSRP